MSDTCLTRVYLESLSADELFALADKFSIDIPTGLQRVFVIEALLESAFGNEESTEAIDNIQADFLQAAALPVQYNITFINVMIRDPLWAYVFWEIRVHDREVFENAPDFKGYCLLVVPVRSDDSPVQGFVAEDSFIVPLSIHDNGRYLNFPPAEGSYKVELCTVYEDNIVPMIASSPFRLPRLLGPPNMRGQVVPEFHDVYQNPLACLSGAGEFPVIRNADREIRLREQRLSAM